RELAFLRPLPVRRLWGVGAVTADKLQAHGIATVADVAELSESTLASLLGGAMGRQLYALSRNIDRRRVTTGLRRRSVGAQRALTLVGFAVSGIGRTGAQQLMLPFEGAPSMESIDEAIDRVRRRYGKSALSRGVLVGRDPGWEMPHLPD